MIKKTYLVTLWIVYLICFPWPLQAQQDSTKMPRPVGNYLLGAGYFPLNTAIDNKAAYDKIKDIADVAFIQRHWKESQNPENKDFYATVSDDIAIARNRGLKIYLALEALSALRDKIELPEGLSGDFSDNQVRQAYLNLIRKVAAGFKPDFFILNVEINMYKKYNPKDYLAYKDFYPQAYQAVKELSPGTKVSVSITYADYDEKNCIDAADKSIFKQFVADFEKNSDMLAVSVYPFCYFKPSAIPVNFFSEIANFSTLPLFIAETGWMSKSFSLSFFFTFKSSPKTQAEYIDRLYKLTEDARAKNKEVSVVNYVGIIDPGKIVCKMIKSKFPVLGWYCSLCLLDMRGKEKPAYLMMKAWKNRNLN